MMRAICLLILVLAFHPLVHASESALTLDVLSPVYTIDKKYKSMEGPQSMQPVYLMKSEIPELLWITGFKTLMVEADGKTPSQPDFMCHVNLDHNPSLHAQLFRDSTGVNGRILTLSQGQLEARFPAGFGMPILSSEPLSVNTQVLNFNEDKLPLQVRHKVTFEFIRDSDLKVPMKPLFNANGFVMKLLEGRDGYFGIEEPDASKHGPSCLPGTAAPNAGGGSVYKDQFSREFSGHWVVKPGRQESHTNITRQLNLPYDTTLHFAAVHLHPFSESLELRDITAGMTVFKSTTRNSQDKIGLLHADSFSSKEGAPLFKDHEYDLVVVYNNTTGIDQDSMAVMLMFLLDKNFKKPDVAASSSGESAPSCHVADATEVVVSSSRGTPRSPAKLVTDEHVLDSGDKERTLLFKGILIDGVYPSMHGPWTRSYFELEPQRTSQHLWVKSYRAEVLDSASGEASQEYMCHTNFDLVVKEGDAHSFRLVNQQMAISQGQKEVLFPAGFALRVSNAPEHWQDVNVMVLNNNEPELRKEFDFKTTIRYADDAAAAQQGLKPLRMKSLVGVCPADAELAAREGNPVCQRAAGSAPNAPYATHWIVPPGQQTITNDVTYVLNLERDVQVHYIWMHIHPYGRSIELRDKTTGSTVWKGFVENAEGRAAVLATDSYSGETGLTLIKGHAYELITVYDNPTPRDADAMASLWIYVRDSG